MRVINNKRYIGDTKKIVQHNHKTPLTSKLLLISTKNMSMSLGFSIIPSSSPTKNPKLGPRLVDKLNPNTEKLTKKITSWG